MKLKGIGKKIGAKFDVSEMPRQAPATNVHPLMQNVCMYRAYVAMLSGPNVVTSTLFDGTGISREG